MRFNKFGATNEIHKRCIKIVVKSAEIIIQVPNKLLKSFEEKVLNSHKETFKYQNTVIDKETFKNPAKRLKFPKPKA